jgi:hypothetical protein
MNVSETSSFDPYRSNSSGPRPAAENASFTFDDVLDIVNPLQHIPIVGWIYREMSGDQIGAPAAIAGGALYGGAMGFAGAVLAAVYESLAGETAETTVSRVLSPPAQSRGIAAYERASALAEL